MRAGMWAGFPVTKLLVTFFLKSLGDILRVLQVKNDI